MNETYDEFSIPGHELFPTNEKISSAGTSFRITQSHSAKLYLCYLNSRYPISPRCQTVNNSTSIAMKCTYQELSTFVHRSTILTFYRDDGTHYVWNVTINQQLHRFISVRSLNSRIFDTISVTCNRLSKTNLSNPSLLTSLSPEYNSIRRRRLTFCVPSTLSVIERNARLVLRADWKTFLIELNFYRINARF